jgi:hypothetical protein
MSTFSFDNGATVSLPHGWANMTEELGDGVWTLARPGMDGGALQFTIALYRGGKVPGVSARELREMVRELGLKQDLGRPFDETTQETGPIVWAAASYHDEADGAFWRAFYGSDGVNIAVVTFICDWMRRREECEDVERIVQSLRFVPAAAAAA